jgi:hypothetical protein
MTMLREDLKKELDKLSDEQLRKIAEFVADLEFQDRRPALSAPFWQRATPTERVKDLCEWVLQLPRNSPSLADEAFSRDSIYEE